MPRSRFSDYWLIILLVASLSACTSLKRFAYEGYKRDEWQQPDKVVASLEIQPGSQVADLGAGGGYFTFRLAEAVGATGQVYAVDIDEGLLEYIDKTAQEKSITNIKTVLAKEDDPALPTKDIDLIFVCNTFHHLENRVDYFKKAASYLREGGRLAIIEFTSGWLNSIGHGTATEVVVDEMQQAGFKLQKQFDFLERQNFLVFERAE